ncbi:MAG TPA: hypothetical protein VL485_14830 [Ktedonobacteraceae bacterium]|jgi:hypothetical protein|nr:hypothetical protein [Ktedonobacteraceae bacterium]
MASGNSHDPSAPTRSRSSDAPGADKQRRIRISRRMDELLEMAGGARGQEQTHCEPLVTVVAQFRCGSTVPLLIH